MSKELTPKTGQFDEIISIIDNARTLSLIHIFIGPPIPSILSGVLIGSMDDFLES